jgi:hypothetical protein
VVTSNEVPATQTIIALFYATQTITRVLLNNLIVAVLKYGSYAFKTRQAGQIAPGGYKELEFEDRSTLSDNGHRSGRTIGYTY